MSEPALRLRGASKSYGKTSAVADLDLDVASGEIVSLIGPSGCGKTTTLRLVAGLERLDRGTIEIDGADCSHLSPNRRKVGFVFQDFALFPHLSVGENTAFGLKSLPLCRRIDRVREVLELVGLGDMMARMPNELSGGQQQRAALARALAPSPSLLLLDEPLSNLDPQLRRQVRHEILSIVRASGAAAVWVTHDHDEGLIVSDKVVVMHSGRTRQSGTPSEVWRSPADAWVAAFMGRGDLLPGTVTGGVLKTALGDVQADELEEGALGEVLVRPEDVKLDDRGHPGVVVRRHFHGSDNVYCVQLEAGGLLHLLQPGHVEIARGETVAVKLASEDLPVFAK
jgi:iron(III) transport system ATP-binding protein